MAAAAAQMKQGPEREGSAQGAAMSQGELELKRLGGIDVPLRLLRSADKLVRCRAALVLASSAHASPAVRESLAHRGTALVHPMLSFIRDAREELATRQAAIRVLVTCSGVLEGGQQFAECARELGAVKVARQVLADAHEPTLHKVLASVLIGNLAVECDRVRDDMASGDGLALLHALVAQRGVTEGNEEREVESDGKDDEAAAEAVLAACLNLAQGHVACAQKWRECSGVRTLLADLRAAAVHIRHAGLDEAACYELLDVGGMDVILPLLSAPHIALQEAAAAVVAASLTSEADEEKSAALRTLMLRSDALLPLTWMLNHDGANVRKHAQRVFETLLDGDGDLLVPMIERGCVPVLHALAEANDSATAEFVARVLQHVQKAVRGPVLTLLLRTLEMEGNAALRGNVAVALLHLSVGNARVRGPFLTDSGLPAAMSLVREGVEGARALRPLFVALAGLAEARAEAGTADDAAQDTAPLDAIDARLLQPDRFNSAAHSDFRIEAAPDAPGKAATFYAHRSVLQAAGGYWAKVAADNPSGSVSMPSVPFAALLAAMRYLYSQNADTVALPPLPEDSSASELDEQERAVLAVLRAAHAFQMARLQRAASEALQGRARAACAPELLREALETTDYLLAAACCAEMARAGEEGLAELFRDEAWAQELGVHVVGLARAVLTA